MKVIQTKLPGVLIIEPKVFGDSRGFFMETYISRHYKEAGIQGPFIQDNLSYSTQGVLRGLHFQNPNPQGKLVSVLKGEAFDVAVDIRIGSPTFGKWEAVLLSEENKRQFYIPEGFAHGFCVTSDSALFFYKCTNYYSPECEGTIIWNDPDIGIDWPIREPIISEKDSKASPLNNLADNILPSYSND